MKYNSTQTRKGQRSAPTAYRVQKSVPANVDEAGYPQTGTKTAGVKIRGTGAAVKGTLARGGLKG